jgi:hypothetical protein
VKKVELRLERQMVSLSCLAVERLKRLRDQLECEIDKNPGMYPGYEDRRLTYSDVINLIFERVGHVQS